MSKIITLIVFSALLLHGCTIEKKRYSNGYHTSWHSFKYRKEKNKPIISNYQNINSLVLREKTEINNSKETPVINSSSNESAEKNKSPEKKHILRKLQNTERDSIPKDSILSATTDNIQLSELAENFLQAEKKLSFWQMIFGLSKATFAAGFSIFYYLENTLSSVLILTGGLGMGISLILSFIFLARRKKSKIEYIQALRRSYDFGHAENLRILNKEISKLTIQKILFAIGILTIIIPPFLLGIVSLLLLVSTSKQRKKLIEERRQMTGKSTELDTSQPQHAQLPPNYPSLKELQMVDINRRIRRNYIFAAAMFFISIIAYLIDYVDVGSYGFLLYPFPLTLLGIFLFTLLILVLKKKVFSKQIQKQRGKS